LLTGVAEVNQCTCNPLGWLITQINADTNHALSARTDNFFYSVAGVYHIATIRHLPRPPPEPVRPDA
jgi:hypothetical protein